MNIVQSSVKLYIEGKDFIASFRKCQKIYTSDDHISNRKMPSMYYFRRRISFHTSKSLYHD